MNGEPRCLDCAALLYTDDVTGELVDLWGERVCSASYLPHAADLPGLAAQSVGPATGMTDRPGRAEPVAGAVPDPCAGADTTPARPRTGPANPGGAQ